MALSISTSWPLDADSGLGLRLCDGAASEESALLSLPADTEDVSRLLLFAPYLSIERWRFGLPLAGLFRRWRGGVRLRLLLRVSRRSSRSLPLRPFTPPLIMSLSSETDRDRDLEEELRRPLFTLDFGGGDRLILLEYLLLFRGGDRDLDSEGVYDLRRGLRSGLRPLPLPPLPRPPCLHLFGDGDLLTEGLPRALGDLEFESPLRRKVRDLERLDDLMSESEIDSDL